MGRRAPAHVGEALRAALGAVEPATLLAAVQTAWAGAVGESIAAEANPVAERDAVVTVACSSATWANELDLLGDQILARLRAELPSDAALEGLRFTLRRDPV
jgi:predicted nucleic acid-binding Zn ribbon protein